jgi:hypothetical protein
MSNPIQIVVEGGVVHEVLHLPPGVNLTIIDCDVEGVAAERIEPSPIDGQPSVISHYTGDATAASNDRIEELLHRAHDFLAHTTEAQTRSDRRELIDDIRVALNLDLTDCENCGAVIPTAEAIEKGVLVLCAECAAD